MKIKKNGQVFTLTESDLTRIVKKLMNEQETDEKLTGEELNDLMRRVYLKYMEGPKYDKYEFDTDVKSVQKYLNGEKDIIEFLASGIGNLKSGKKYKKLNENGIYDSDTHWQLGIWLSHQIDTSFWRKNRHSFVKPKIG